MTSNGDDDTLVIDEIIIGDNDESPMVIRMLKKILFLMVMMSMM